MRIAMPCLDGQIFPHFGKAEAFKIYFVEDDQITRELVMAAGGSGHENAIAFLKSAGVGLVICGAIGGAAIKAMDEAGIMVMGGIAGNCDEKIREFVSGKLKFVPADKAASHCSHHSRREGSSCQETDCLDAADCEHHCTH